MSDSQPNGNGSDETTPSPSIVSPQPVVADGADPLTHAVLAVPPPAAAAGTTSAPASRPISPAAPVSNGSAPAAAGRSRNAEFEALLEAPVIDIAKLRELSVGGIPETPGTRSLVWKLLLDFLPPDRERWPAVLAGRRALYSNFLDEVIVNPYAATATAQSDHPLNDNAESKWGEFFKDNEMLEQIDKDVRRTLTDISLFQSISHVPRPTSKTGTGITMESLCARVDRACLSTTHSEGGVKKKASTSYTPQAKSKPVALFQDDDDDDDASLFGGSSTSTPTKQKAAKTASADSAPFKNAVLAALIAPVDDPKTAQALDALDLSRSSALSSSTSSLSSSSTELSKSNTESDLMTRGAGHQEAHWEVVERILFVFAKLNPGIAYVQGMNEILGPLYYIFATDRSSEWADHCEADAFFCFTTIMAETRDNFIKHLDDTVAGIGGSMKQLMDLTLAIDPVLHAAMVKKNVQPTFFSFRWITLLFSQEFKLPDVFRLWDSIFAHKLRFGFVLFICAAMIVSVRSRLLAGEFADCIKLLQNYPPEIDIRTITTLAERLAIKWPQFRPQFI
ncbi:TBC1D13 protein [Capsaspora owczarzaki ATCC 30864]|uniref:TBC1D13 protein n=1 Tax=Capsaspora owczarzaki (strain ATCC 30864) TaxID=595528 RepID=A0A0D2X4N5_CAPO3|nr:TBC1D13 protein [Capsaspora owczarzaki ATCC 30864]KJE96369.1 TBC1D13 protein [Capsaspora owczarzaki ATCC 30864]|eukprot:XP_004344328.1 TBC1D13 protein [Capsaspora owczarzaki ATCC 30864]